jgi:dihydrofolate reductase
MTNRRSQLAGKRIVLVAALAQNGVIGADGDIPWHIPEDLAHFKTLTLGHTLVMGRATYDSIGRPLPGRTTVVLTRDREWSAEGVLVAHSLLEALDLAADLPGDVIVAGGAEVYQNAMPYATHQVLTEVRQSPPGDTYYPDWPRSDWHETDRREGPGVVWVWLARNSPPLPAS